MKVNKKDQRTCHDFPPPNVCNVLCPACEKEIMFIRTSREVYAYHKAYFLQCKECGHTETRIEKVLWSVSDENIRADEILDLFTPGEISNDLYVHASNLMLMDLIIRSSISSCKQEMKRLKRELESVHEKYEAVLDIAYDNDLTDDEINRQLEIASEISHAGVRGWLAKHREKLKVVSK
ncbi:hypothetical protein [Chromobacterium amazonense]|uniref:hypothetical protein n=1 Tax=Chromobacterium amazonense TaxID=1382803 RepID=UPI000A9C0235|nr:hypothetical protein [Chromobacterium amazonense]